MPFLTVKKLDDILSDLTNQHEKPEKILIDFKVYAELMNDRYFFKESAKAVMDPNKREYKN